MRSDGYDTRIAPSKRRESESYVLHVEELTTRLQTWTRSVAIHRRMNATGQLELMRGTLRVDTSFSISRLRLGVRRGVRFPWGQQPWTPPRSFLEAATLLTSEMDDKFDTSL
jgi:hypothetical protein